MIARRRLAANRAHDRSQVEARYAAEIQAQTGCTRAEALRVAFERVESDERARMFADRDATAGPEFDPR